MPSSRIVGNLHGIGFSFEVDREDVHQYAREHLAPMVGEGAPSEPPLRVISTLRWVDGQPWPRAQWGVADQRWTRVDRDLYLGFSELLWLRVDDLRDLVLHLRAAEGQALALHGTFFFRLGNSSLTDWLRRGWVGRRVSDFRRRRFPTLVSYLVYYPLWWVAETERGFHPIHAGAVATPTGGVVLAGASGVGKSTLATALAGEDDMRLLSDSFVFVRGRDIYAVPEPILLDRNALEWLESRRQILQPIPHRYMLERRGYRVVREKCQARTVARLVLFPQRGPEWICRRLSPQQAWFRLSAANLMVNDLRRYYALAAAWEQLEPRGLVCQRERAMEALLRETPAFELQIPPGTPSATVVARIRELLHSLPGFSEGGG
ncbi:MAG: hypothetical protein KatS3mg077_1027 [Candidatus Binatia bacterium]|nr:MAG: hypothetical protein KatS3mg077_1027 [Candidatus Binatia bacterium]